MSRPLSRFLATFSMALNLSLPGLSLPGLLLLVTPASYGAEKTFPYQAIVVNDEAEVRCGPGNQFYATGVIKQNESVVVHRHDHGGWYMIAPPAGSFSWIEASVVEKTSSNRGVVSLSPGEGQGSRAVVRIGSRLSDDHAYYGRELSNGDEVVILGEKSLNGPRGPVEMLMISPPSQEFRWVKGEALVPQNQQVRQQMSADPYQIPPQHRERLVAEGRAPITSPLPKTMPRLTVPGETESYATFSPPVEKAFVQSASRPSLPIPSQSTQGEHLALQAPGLPVRNSSPDQGNSDLILLGQIDREYAEMTSKDPREWKLDGILQRYRDLAARAPANVGVLVHQRLEVAEQRHEIGQRYQRFIQVSAETAQRDAELVAQQAASPSAMQTAGFETEAPTFPEGPETQHPAMAMGTPPQFMRPPNADPRAIPRPGMPVPGAGQIPGNGQMNAQMMNSQMTAPMSPQHPAMAASQGFQMQGYQTPSYQAPGYQGQGYPMPAPHGSNPYGSNPQSAFPQGAGPALPNGVPGMNPAMAPGGNGGFSGAGVLHRMQDQAGFPSYALVAPDGRLLAYVSPEQGVQVDQWLGKPVGVVGRRAPDPAIGHDHIHAQQLMPVQLTR
ncbi:MAG TPA: hypothetical protein VNQ76_15850 [Planctomicrobium sp.]|nr:hypothetical protein [Planctomicrobium sp.]